MKITAIILSGALALTANAADFFATPAPRVAPADAASGTPWVFSKWNDDVTLPAGSYHANNKSVNIANDRKITVGPGCLLERAQFSGDRTIRWNVTGSFLRDVHVHIGLGSNFKAVDTAFESCGMTKTGGWFVDMWSTRWVFENCVFAGKFMTGDLGLTDYSVRAEHCSFHNIELPKIGYKHDPADVAQGNELKFLNCRFVNCDVPESFLASTVDCVFEDCHISAKRGDWSAAKKPINVTAYIVSHNNPPANFENGNLKVTFKTVAPPVCGSTLRYTASGKNLTLPLRTTGSPVLIGSVDKTPVASATPAPAPAPATPAPVQPVAAVSMPSDPVSRDLVKTYRNSLVFVTGADGAGSGFVATLGGANFLFTNAHVAAGIKGAGFKSLDGTKVQAGAPTIAVGHDIFRLQLGAGGTPFEIMAGVDEKVTLDDEVVVLGNSEGAGVINAIKGKVVGIGPQLVEVDAPFQPGNSGSPIIHLKTGKVIGVATYLTIKKYDAATKEVLKAPVIRRFGYRLDSVKTWEPVAWPTFYAQAAEMQAIETLTGNLDNFLIDLSKNNRPTPGAHSNPAIRSRIDQWAADSKKRMNPKDAAAVDQNFISFLKIACRSDITAAQAHLTYDYFQRQLTEQQQQRGEIAEIFDKIIKEIQKDR